MHTTDFVNWLIAENHMSVRSAKDVVSRCSRIERMLCDNEINDNTMSKLVTCCEFQSKSMFVKSQLKRAITLRLEYISQSEDLSACKRK